MMLQVYISAVSITVFVLSIAAAAGLFANPKTFNVKKWVKAVGYLNFLIDMTGGLTVFGHTALGWPLYFLYVGIAMILTSAGGLLAIFLYVHLRVIPLHRKQGL